MASTRAAADPGKFLHEPRHDGFPAALVRLPAIDAAELAELITDPCRCQAPRVLAAKLGRLPDQDTASRLERAVSN